MSTNTDSAMVTLLRDSSLDWVGRLGRGVDWMLSALILGVCTYPLVERVSFLGPVIELCPDVVWFIGIWMITAPEPVHSHHSFGIRSVTRGVSVLGVTFDIVFAAVSYVPDLGLLTLRFVGLILGSLVLLLTSFQLANLAARIPDVRLANQSRFVITSLAIVSIFLGGSILYVEGNDSISESNRGSTALIVAAIPVVLITFALWFWCLRILRRFQKLLVGISKDGE